MPFALEFPDSELLDVVADASIVRMRFAAAAVRDVDTGERGWLAPVQLEFGNATFDDDTTHAFGKITQATLRHDTLVVGRLQIPGTANGALELTLHVANGTRLVVTADTLTASVAADARFTPDLSC